MRGPGFARTDLSLFKNFDFIGNQRIQIRIEAFNIFNQERFGQPGGNIARTHDVRRDHERRRRADRVVRRDSIRST